MSRFRLTLLIAAGARRGGARRRRAKTTILMSGSTSVYPLETELAKAYVKKYPGTASSRSPRAAPTSASATSPASACDRRRPRVTCRAATRAGSSSTRSPATACASSPTRTTRSPNLSQQQVQDIFSGKVRRWDDVPGAKVTGPINLNVRTQASGTQDAFRNIFMGQTLNVAPSARRRRPTASSRRRSRSDQNAIGYVDFKFTEGTHAVPYKGVACNLRNAKSGQYPGVRNFWFVTLGAPGRGQEVHRFRPLAAVQSSIVAKDTCRTSSARWWSDRRVGPRPRRGRRARTLVIAGMTIYVFERRGRPSRANGLAWFGPGGNANVQLRRSSTRRRRSIRYTLRAWPLLYGTALAAGGAVLVGARALDALGAVHRRLRAAVRWRACSSPSCGCWPACRASSTG